MTINILFFIFHMIIHGPRVCNKHLNNKLGGGKGQYIDRPVTQCHLHNTLCA